MKYSEEKDRSKSYKENYVEGIKKVIKSRQKELEKIRDSYCKDIFNNQDKYRQDFKEMLGWPLSENSSINPIKCTSEKLSDEGSYSIYRLQFEIMDGLVMSGLFFKSGNEKKPLVIVQHGGLGTPELISGVYGTTGNYNNMLQRVLQYDVHIFAPQLIIWSDDYEVEFDRRALDAQLKRIGGSMAALEIYGIQRILDYFEQKEFVSAFGMVGLSYGGFYTLFTAAIDQRIKSAISCSFFNTRDEYGWPDWTWFKSAEKFDDAEIACLVYPRHIHLQIGNKDNLFDYTYGQNSFEKLKKLAQKVGTKWVEFTVFDGNHEFFKDDLPLERLVEDLKK